MSSKVYVLPLLIQMQHLIVLITVVRYIYLYFYAQQWNSCEHRRYRIILIISSSSSSIIHFEFNSSYLFFHLHICFSTYIDLYIYSHHLSLCITCFNLLVLLVGVAPGSTSIHRGKMNLCVNLQSIPVVMCQLRIDRSFA